MGITVQTAVTLHGVGLHGGQDAFLTISPARSGTGVRFVRTDVAPEISEIPARYDLVTDTQLCTKLTNSHGVSVGTVEHVMAAMAGLGITDAVLRLDGPEVPIMDGSSAPFVEAVADVGLSFSGDEVRGIRILKDVEVTDGDKIARLSPAGTFEMDYRIEFSDPAIGVQIEQMVLTSGAFVTDLSDCRTFGHLHEVEYMRSLGLARGGSLKNAIVVDRGRVLNPEGLRRPDEFVRHKMLDAVGDLALAGAPIIGRYTGVKSGHGLTNKLLRALFDQPDAWCWDTLDEAQMLGGGALGAPRSQVLGQALAG